MKWISSGGEGGSGGGSGDVVGPASATDDNLATFDGATGKLIQDSGQSVASVLALAGDVDGPASATDNALTRFDGTTGKVVQNSVGILSDAGALSGLTQLDVDNLRLDGNAVTSTNANGHITLDANGTGAIQVGTVTQSDVHIYGLFTDTSNYQRLRLECGSSSGAVALNKAGSGDANATLYIANQNSGGAVEFQSGNASRWQMTPSGHFIATTDNSFDIGASGATRPRNLFLAGNATVGNLKLATNTLSSENANGNIVLDPNGSGEVQLSSANLSAFGNLQNASLSFWLRSGDARFGSGQHLVFCSGDINSAADVGLKRDSAGVWLDTDASTGLGKRLTGRVVEANTAGSGAPNVLAVTESRKLLTNEGATAENYHTLPSAAAGIEFVFYCQDTDGIRVVAGAGDTIRRGATVSAAAGFVKSTTVGSALILVAINATEWVAISEIGTWTTDA